MRLVGQRSRTVCSESLIRMLGGGGGEGAGWGMSASAARELLRVQSLLDGHIFGRG